MPFDATLVGLCAAVLSRPHDPHTSQRVEDVAAQRGWADIHEVVDFLMLQPGGGSLAEYEYIMKATEYSCAKLQEQREHIEQL